MKIVSTSIIALLLSALQLISAQEVFIMGEDTSIVTGNGILYDSGGPDGDYGVSEYYTCVIQGVAGGDISLTFTEFDLESGYDDLQVYDGEDESAPLVFDGTGNELEGYGFVPESGKAYLVFQSDGSVTMSGFELHITSESFSQEFSINWETSMSDEENIVNLCEPETLELFAEPTFYQNNLNYHQSPDSVKYRWEIEHNGETILAQEGWGFDHMVYPFSEQGIYTVSLAAEDQMGLAASEQLQYTVTLGPIPEFEYMNYPDTVCYGEVFDFEIDAVNFAPGYLDDVISSNHDTTYIPDGSGAEYTLDIPVHAPDGVEITAEQGLESLCVNMEHSYMGDLDIWLECPNGQTATLFDQACASGWFGEATDGDSSPNPGTGYDYCWTASSSNGTMEDNCPGGSNSLPAGDYQPVDPFSMFIGCPVDGNWTLHILDNLSIDNGYVFSVDVMFSSGVPVLPGEADYQILDYSSSPDNPTFQWEGDEILFQAGGNATAQPAESGLQMYSLTVENAQGCTYSHDYPVFVLPESDPTCCVNMYAGEDRAVCGSPFELHAQTNADSIRWSLVSGPDTVIMSDSSNAGVSVTAGSLGVYRFACQGINTTEHCQASDTVTIELVTAPHSNNFQITEVPSQMYASLHYTGNAPPDAEYNWIVPEADSIEGYGSGPLNAYFSESGTYTAGLSVVYGCVSDTLYKNFEMSLPEPVITITPPSCYGAADGSVMFQDDSLGIYSVSLDGTTVDSVMTGLEAGEYTFIVRFEDLQVRYYTVELLNPVMDNVNLFEQELVPFCSDSIEIDVPATYPFITWPDGSHDSTYLVTEPQQVWVTVVDSAGCYSRDTVEYVQVVTQIEPLLAGYIENNNLLIHWSSVSNLMADSLSVLLWHENVPPVMGDGQITENGIWTGSVNGNPPQYVYLEYNSICGDTLQSDILEVFHLQTEMDINNDLFLNWELDNMQLYNESLDVLSDDYPYSDFVYLDSHSVASQEWAMPAPDVQTRFKLKAYLNQPLIMGSDTITELYSNRAYFEPSGIETGSVSGLVVYPNPFSDVILCEVSRECNADRLELVDATGKTVRIIPIDNTTEGVPVSIDVPALAPGLYSLNVYSADGVESMTLVKR